MLQMQLMFFMYTLSSPSIAFSCVFMFSINSTLVDTCTLSISRHRQKDNTPPESKEFLTKVDIFPLVA